MKPTLLAANLTLTACAYIGTASEFDPSRLEREAGWVRVVGVPLLRQGSDDECGPAALAMVMARWNRTERIADVKRDLGFSGGVGIRAGAMRDLARRRGFDAYLFRGELADLARELGAGRPVIIGVAKPHVGGRRSHYEVVVAVHPASRRVVTLDPAGGWRENCYGGLLEEWDAAGRPLLLVFPRTEPKGGGE